LYINTNYEMLKASLTIVLYIFVIERSDEAIDCERVEWSIVCDFFFFVPTKKLVLLQDSETFVFMIDVL
jgi:hypothetical protein